MKKILNKKIFFSYSIFFFLFLRSQNLIQAQNYIIINIATFQIILLLLIVLISF